MIAVALISSWPAAATVSANTQVWGRNTVGGFYFDGNWYDTTTGVTTGPEVGSSLVVNNGGLVSAILGVNQYITLSSTSVDGQSLTVTNNSTANFQESGSAGGYGYGLLLDTGASLNVNTGGTVDVSGPLTIGQDANNSATVHVEAGGTINAGTTPGTDQTLYLGNAGSGTVNQSGGVVNAPKLVFGAYSTGTGTYNFSGGNLNIGTISRGSGTGTFNFTGGTLDVGTWDQSMGTLTLNGPNALLDVYTHDMSLGWLLNVVAGQVAIGNGHSLSLTSMPYGSTMGYVGGALNMSSGSLTVPNNGEIVFLGGGTFNQTGGSTTVGTFYFENQLPSPTGQVSSGTFQAGEVIVDGAAQFAQSGGTVSVTYLNISAEGSNFPIYALSGGTLTAQSILALQR